MKLVTFVIEISRDLLSSYRRREDKNCFNCPIAVKLEKVTKTKWGVSRSGAYSKRFGRVDWPAWITQWIDDLGEEKDVKPISFPIQVEDKEAQNFYAKAGEHKTHYAA